MNNIGSAFSAAIIALIVLVVAFGNWVLFTGDLKGNELLIVITAIVDVASVIFIVHILRNIAIKTEPSANLKASDNEKTAREIKEKYKKYSLSPAFLFLSQKKHDVLSSTDTNYQVRWSVEQISAAHAELMNKYAGLDDRLNSILSCTHKKTGVSEAEYLSGSEEVLEKLSAQMDDISAELSRQRVAILGTRTVEFSELLQSVREVLHSARIIANPPPSHVISFDQKSEGFNRFKWSTMPIAIEISDISFYILPFVVLAFDDKGMFINAYNPSAVSVRVEAHETEEQGSVPNEAIVLKTGYTFEQEDGKPEPGRANNPVISTVKYARIIFNIAGAEYSFIISNYDSADKLAKAVNSYSRSVSPVDNVGHLLDLIALCVPESEAEIQPIIAERKKQHDANDRCCKIIEI